jgi:DNA polymerase-3 subunit beta
MKLQILQEDLAKAVSLASRFTSLKAQLPVLGNILLSSTKTKVYIMSTNLEISVATAIGAKVEEDGEISIPSKVLSELVSNLPKEPISIESEQEQMKLSSSGFSSTVMGMAGSDFPKVPTSVPKEGSFVLPKKEFTEALSQVTYAVSTDETRPVLTGVLVVGGKGEISLVATDGFRLSRKAVKVADVPEIKLVLPKLILMELSKDFTVGDGINFNLNDKDKQAIFGVGDVTLTSRLLEGEYPDFEKIIPTKSVVNIRVDKEEFLRCVKLASVFARDAANIIKIKVLKESLKITAEGVSGSQEAKVDAKVEKEDGDFEISFNFRFLEDFIHSVKGEEIVMELSGVSTAGIFKDSSDPSYLHLIMPIRQTT